MRDCALSTCPPGRSPDDRARRDPSPTANCSQRNRGSDFEIEGDHSRTARLTSTHVTTNRTRAPSPSTATCGVTADKKSMTQSLPPEQYVRNRLSVRLSRGSLSRLLQPCHECRRPPVLRLVSSDVRHIGSSSVRLRRHSNSCGGGVGQERAKLMLECVELLLLACRLRHLAPWLLPARASASMQSETALSLA